MEDFSGNADELVKALIEVFKRSGDTRIVELLLHSESNISYISHDVYSSGEFSVCTLDLQIPSPEYANISDELENIEAKILEKLLPIMRKFQDVSLKSVIISPVLRTVEAVTVKNYTITNEVLVRELEAQKILMVNVSTGGQRIQDANAEYVNRYKRINAGLAERLIKNPNPYTDLWAWYGKWSCGDLPTYQSRRNYIGELLNPLIKLLSESKKTQGAELFEEPTGWARVDRTISEMRIRLAEAKTPEQFQAVGLLCRENLISLAQVVFDSTKHKTEENITISKTDAKRMLDAYLSVELAGQPNETARKHAKASLDLANDLTHHRTADFRQAALCAEATTSVINIIAIISGRRDPE